VVYFEANGAGGRELEAAIRGGQIAAVIEVSLTELAGELLQTGYGAGRDRLTAAAIAGLPQIITLGGLDAAQIGPDYKFGKRPVALFEGARFIRTTTAENDRLGLEIAFKSSAASTPPSLIVPGGGLSILDHPGSAFWQLEADAALLRSVRNWLSHSVRVVEIPSHINDETCAEEIVARFNEMTVEH
jgi:uncharacterized protein (UPF0261 family)